ncbi:hypothetical protein LLH23_04065 [bacterium]|nr:hypothetical protein [bacterium]
MAPWQTRWDSAVKFWEVAQAAADGDHALQAAANAILAVIGANDAVCLRLKLRQPTGDDHEAVAPRFLQECCAGTAYEREAPARCRQLREVLRHKNNVSYNGRPVSQEVLKGIMRRSESFLGWAASVLRESFP